MSHSGLTRRQFHRLLAASGLACATAGSVFGRAARADDATPTVFTWATMDVPEFFPTYVEKHGNPPKFAIFGDQEEALTKVRSGFKPDILYPQSYTSQRWYDAGLLHPIDTAKLSNWNDIFPNLRNMPGVTIGGNVVWVPTDWGLTSVVVRTDLAPEYTGKDSWSILWDQRYSGRIAVLDSMMDTVSAAAIYCKVDPFKMSADDLAKVRAALEKQRPLLRFYSNDPTSLQQALVSGEVVAALTWSDVFVNLKAQGLPVHYMQPPEGAMAWVGGLSILKDSPLIDRDHEVIDAYLDPRARVVGMKNYGYGSATRGGFKAVDDATLERLGLPRDPTALLEKCVLQRPMVNQDDAQRMFEDVKQGV